MGWSVASFRAAKPEFGVTPEALVTQALADAASECDEAVFGQAYDQAVGLYAAHLLSIAPQGQQSRLASDLSDTTYYQQWLKLARKRAGGPHLLGGS